MDITIPAIASPRPDSRPSLVLINATIPGITLSGTGLTKPSRNAAIAHLLTGRPASPGPASSGSVASGEVIVKATVALQRCSFNAVRTRAPAWWSGREGLGHRRGEAIQHRVGHHSVRTERCRHRNAFGGSKSRYPIGQPPGGQKPR